MVSPDHEIQLKGGYCPAGSEEVEVTKAELINLMETADDLTAEMQEALVELREIKASSLTVCVVSEDENEDGDEE